ncbi:MAG: bifunctional riboflavin kinase/FMN adenylyltransferase [Phycisphaerae bacterium]|nr:bifunctional riboflavin kinase/FMN adenylyltransferase [Phycisphaerae bacterium]
MQVVTIGNFDGVHRGHQAIVALAASVAGSGGEVVAVTFEPLPAAVLRPGAAPPRLTGAEDRRTHLLSAGCTQVISLDPASGVLQLNPAEFVADLRSRVSFDAVVEGADFRFGRVRSGTVADLRALGEQHGFRTVVAPEFETALSDGQVVAPRSSIVRWLLQLGRVHDAAHLLGRPHAVRGPVVQGDQRGRTLGFPTANIQCDGQQLPGDGVYAGTAHTPIGTFRAAISVGVKPTFASCERACEAYLIDFPGAVGEYGWPIRIEFERWLREQWKFSSIDALVGQLHRDVAHSA